MHITSQDICAAADQLKGFVGFNRKLDKHIVRFSEDSFGMDVAEDSITPSSEFVWRRSSDEVMTLGRDLIEVLLAQNIDERLNISEPLRVYLRRNDLPEISARRRIVA
ncbi:DUF2025 family protein [Pseudomonas defluvii]|jgi:hypothetical protein|uniref:DUF2025 family protein n=1 Tax=Pseudomonas TaxID=286 RepID=UPI0008118543|nr:MULTISPECIES: DUF2025 family protein [Pseudomonas]ATR84413.1 DUF2025 domain-containing protein [Pseudomonas sp. HLS-6]MEE3635419.1 DUF2025 family protein [Pseudomonas sp. AL 58]WJM96418.1 DUF2025 family protein [Pseudomonas defluvii]